MKKAENGFLRTRLYKSCDTRTSRERFFIFIFILFYLLKLFFLLIYLSIFVVVVVVRRALPYL